MPATDMPRKFILLGACAVVLGSISLAAEVSTEFNTIYSSVGEAPTKLQNRQAAGVSEQNSLLHLVVSPQITDGPLLRLGAEWQRYSFGIHGTGRLPNTLQAANLVIGADLELSSWLVRIEAQPGFYGASDDLNGKNFDIPFIVGGSYIVNSDLQWILGISFDINRNWIVLPGVGLRWKFSEKWTLNAVPPAPRLEYALNEKITAFAGAQLLSGVFRAGDSFGATAAGRRLRDAIVEFTEVRVGAGIHWKISDSVGFEAESGYMPYRQFDFHRAGSSFESYSGAPYGQIGLTTKF